MNSVSVMISYSQATKFKLLNSYTPQHKRRDPRKAKYLCKQVTIATPVIETLYLPVKVDRESTHRGR